MNPCIKRELKKELSKELNKIGKEFLFVITMIAVFGIPAGIFVFIINKFSLVALGVLVVIILFIICVAIKSFIDWIKDIYNRAKDNCK